MDTVNTQLAVATVIVGISCLVFIIVPIISVVIAARRHPPLDREIYKEYARIVQLEQMELRVNRDIERLSSRYEKTIGEIFRVIRDLQGSVEKSFGDISKAIGRVEGSLEEHTKQERNQ